MLTKKFLLSYCLAALLSYSCFSQATNRHYFYLKRNHVFVLSEKKRLDSSFCKLNSLFIWKKDTVYRLVFEYEDKKSKIITQPKGGYNFYPLLVFLNKAGHINLYDKPSTELKENNNAYNSFRFSGKKSELTKFTKQEIENGEAFTIKLKILINRWNEKFNPMADKLASIPISDGSSEVLLRNSKREAAFHNNFPLAFSFPGVNSIYFAKVYLICVYKSFPVLNKDLAYQYLKTFKLISTVSFEDGASDTVGEVGSFGSFYKKTLPYVFELQLPADTSKMFDQLSQFKLAKYNDEYASAVIANNVIGETVTDFPFRQSKNPNTSKQDYNKKLVTVKEKLQNQNGLAEYCKECFDTSYSIRYKLTNHCPINIDASIKYADQNWRYSFSSQNLHFFSVENLIRAPFNIWSSDQKYEHLNNIWNWQLMSPGIGYWLSNSEDFGFKYKPSAIDYYVNGKKVN